LSAVTALNRRAVLAVAAATYAGVLAAFVFIETPGLGIGHFFYIPVCLVALVTDELIGAAAGAAAAGVYLVGIEVAPGVPTGTALTGATGIRLVTYMLVGALIGFYASRNRLLVARLTESANRDFVTGLGNARHFDEELARRCSAGAHFALVLADVDGLKQLNDIHGHAAGNSTLRRIGETLVQHADPGDVVARIGGDEFALLTSMPTEQLVAFSSRVNRTLGAEDLSVSFGITVAPEDGQTAAELFHKADDRLFAAKLVRQNRATVVALAKTS
jgi:diguanylate cyclase (GGDEF)-like protein